MVASAEAKPSAKQGKARRVFPQPSTRIPVFVKNPIRSKRRAPKVSKGRAESPLVASAEAKPSAKQGKARRVFPLPSTRNLFFVKNPIRSKRRAPKVSKGRAESPLVASAEAKSSAKQRKARKVFPLPSTRSQFLVGGFVRLRADEVLSITGKYPKGAGGGQRVHGTWPPPDPPLLSYSAPLASQGRAQRGSHPFPGGPLSPSAQSIPPPAVGRRFIPGVMARNRCGRDALGGNAALDSAPCTKNRVAGFAACNPIFCLFHTAAEIRPRTGSPAAFRESARGAFLRKAASRKPCCFR